MRADCKPGVTMANLIRKIRKSTATSPLRILAWLITAALLLTIAACTGQPAGDTNPQPVASPAEYYDLIVAGSDPEGIAAAVSGARNGLSVLLVDTRPELGGLMTRGWLNSIDMNYAPGGGMLNEGIFGEFFEKIEGDSFDVTTAAGVFNALVNAEPNLDYLPGVEQMTPVVENAGGSGKGADAPVVRGIKVVMDDQAREIRADSLIDATQDGDMAALAGVPYTVGQEDIGRQSRQMAATLVFKLDNVSFGDWLKIHYYLRLKDESHFTGATRYSAWGFSEFTSQYQPTTDRLLLRGLNIGRQKDGSLLVNALLIYGMDPLDPDSRRQGREIAVKELPRVVEFLNDHVPGLAKAQLAGVAPELYVRESRHMLCEYILTVDDVLENRDFDDRIALGSYPVDMQPAGPDIPGAIIGSPQQYAVPFRCLVPLNVDGLLVVGRAAGFDSLAHGSARTIPVGMATGQAAGAAAALAKETGVSYRTLAGNPLLIGQLQNRLNRQGMELQPFEIPNELAEHWCYQGLKFVRGLGLAVGGYRNDYRLDGAMTDQMFINVLSRTVRQTGAPVPGHPRLVPEANVFNIYDASYMLVRYQGLDMSKKEAFAYLEQQGLFERHKEHWAAFMEEQKPLTQGAGYMLIREWRLALD